MYTYRCVASPDAKLTDYTRLQQIIIIIFFLITEEELT